MTNKQKRPTSLVILGAISSFMLIVTIIYIYIAGTNLISTLILVSAVGGLVIPAATDSNGFLELITGIFEVFIEGIQTILQGIFDFIGSIFG